VRVMFKNKRQRAAGGVSKELGDVWADALGRSESNWQVPLNGGEHGRSCEPERTNCRRLER